MSRINGEMGQERKGDEYESVGVLGGEEDVAYAELRGAEVWSRGRRG